MCRKSIRNRPLLGRFQLLYKFAYILLVNVNKVAWFVYIEYAKGVFCPLHQLHWTKSVLFFQYTVLICLHCGFTQNMLYCDWSIPLRITPVYKWIKNQQKANI